MFVCFHWPPLTEPNPAQWPSFMRVSGSIPRWLWWLTFTRPVTAYAVRKKYKNTIFFWLKLFRNRLLDDALYKIGTLLFFFSFYIFIVVADDAAIVPLTSFLYSRFICTCTRITNSNRDDRLQEYHLAFGDFSLPRAIKTEAAEISPHAFISLFMPHSVIHLTHSCSAHVTMQIYIKNKDIDSRPLTA